MKKTFTYADYLSDKMNSVDRQIILQDLLKIPEKSTALYINAFGVEYYPTLIKDGVKLIFRDFDKIYVCFKQMQYVKRGHKRKGDSAGYVKDNAEFVLSN